MLLLCGQIRTSPEPGALQFVSMDGDLLRFRVGSASFSLRTVAKRVVLDLAFFSRPRGAKQHAFWSVKSLFPLLNIKTYDSQCSKWLAMGYKNWQRHLVERYGDGHIVFGMGSTLTFDGPVGAWQRCLPDFSFSTLGMLDMLHKWSVDGKKSGGLSEPASRTAALELFRSLIIAYFPHKQTTITIDLVPVWVCTWPRPSLTAGIDTAQLVVSADGLVCLDDLRSKAAVGPEWLRLLLAQEWTHGRFVPLEVFLQRAYHHKALFTQLLVKFSWLLERRLVDLGASKPQRLGLNYQWVTPEDDAVGGTSQSHFMCQYVLCGVDQLGAELQDLGMSTDKGWAHGWALQSTQMFSGDLALQAIPQVAFLFSSDSRRQSVSPPISRVCNTHLRSQSLYSESRI